MKNTTKKKIQARVVGSKVTRRPRATAPANTLPRGKAKTAYELLERVCAHIAAEPKRYYQGWWVFRGKDAIANGREAENVDFKAPECNTIACRAGWIVLLHDGLRTKKVEDGGHGTAGRARQILGMDLYETQQLFDGGAVCSGLKPGTRKYMREGIRGLKAFMAQHAAHLKSRSLKGV